MKNRAIIIEDEEPARDLIKRYLESIPEIELIGEFSDGFAGLKGIQELKPDIVFLDVQMPKLNGFELLELLDDAPEIIFTTAYDNFAIKAFEHNAVDYLLKPFSADRMREAIFKALERSKGKDKSSLSGLKGHIDGLEEKISRVVVKNRNEIKVIPVTDILYLESQDDYVMIYTIGGKYLKQKTMNYFEAHLEKKEFIRVHRSYIVNTGQISKLEPYGKESWVLILKHGEKVPVSRGGYKELKGALGI